MAAWVPTGMNTGVSILPWGVARVPRLAALFLSFFKSLNFMVISQESLADAAGKF
jgi:hypothetical protein